jgi:hypothetical protein
MTLGGGELRECEEAAGVASMVRLLSSGSASHEAYGER